MYTSHFVAGDQEDAYLDALIWLISDLNSDCMRHGTYRLREYIQTETLSSQAVDQDTLTTELYYSVIKPRLNNLGDGMVRAGLASSYCVLDMTLTHPGGIEFNSGALLAITISHSNMNALGVQRCHLHTRLSAELSIEHLLAERLVSVLAPSQYLNARHLYNAYILIKSRLAIDYAEVARIVVDTYGWRTARKTLLRDAIPKVDDIERALATLELVHFPTGSRMGPLDKYDILYQLTTHYDSYVAGFMVPQSVPK